MYEDVTAQGWNRYFDRLLGPTFPIIVKEFWIHATSSNHQFTSYVMGKKIVITEDLTGNLLGTMVAQLDALTWLTSVLT